MHYPFSCNLIVVWVAIDIHSELQILSASAWYYFTPSVATQQWFELQSMYTSSCNIECFCLILYYPFCCNWTVVWVATDVHFKLQILRSYAWYYTPSATTRQWFKLQSIYTSSCKLILNASAWYCTTPSVATGQWFELQSMYTSSCKYWVLSSDTVLPLLLQSDSGSSCNCYTLRVASTKFFRLIVYPFSCNPTVVRVAIDIHSELQILSASAWNCTTPSVATRQWLELQLIYTLSLQILSASA
jgi:multisubunit Na+/H+ antiporter MnhE subunit